MCGVVLGSFSGRFGSILGYFSARFSDRFLRYVFGHLLMDLGVHFGAILAPKTSPVSTPTRKGRPSILNNSPMKIHLFDSVGAAGGSRERPLKRNTFYNEIRTPKCLQNDTEMDPKRIQNGIQKRCRNCFRKLCEIIPKNAPKWYPKWCPWGSKIMPRRSRGHPPGTGTSPGSPLEPPGPHFGSPGGARDTILL